MMTRSGSNFTVQIVEQTHPGIPGRFLCRCELSRIQIKQTRERGDDRGFHVAVHPLSKVRSCHAAQRGGAELRPHSRVANAATSSVIRFAPPLPIPPSELSIISAPACTAASALAKAQRNPSCAWKPSGIDSSRFAAIMNALI